MICINYSTILTFFQIVLYLIRWHRIRCEHNAVEEQELHTINLARHFTNIVLNWLTLIISFRCLRTKQRKRRLLKPHLLIQMMHGFQRNLRGLDLWAILEQNWINFFWLTGEIPQTLAILVQRLIHLFINQTHQGRATVIDFRNQVIFSIEPLFSFLVWGKNFHYSKM